MSVDFCHLHCHSQYSLLDGASRIGDMISRAHKMGQKAIALTDHGNMFGAIEFYKACKNFNEKVEAEGKQGVRPVVGMEAYIVPNGQSRMAREKVNGEYDHHCLLWASNEDGFKNLMKLSTLAYSEGFYMHPRLDQDALAKHSAGLLGASGCLGSEVPSTILNRDYETARRIAGRYIEIFGQGNFYFELQNQCGALDPVKCGDEARELAQMQKKVNQAIVKMAREFEAPLIATNDSHYTSRDDAEAHDALLCIGTGKLIADVNRMRFACSEFYLKNNDEMFALFPDHPEALNRTQEVAERCNLKLTFGQYHYPVFAIPTGEPQDIYFRKLVEEGLTWRYGQPVPSDVKARAEEELRVLIKMGFVGYLLIVWDIVHTARKMGIPVGPGRGSAAGSIVCYALGITNLEPLRYALLFERFVNEGRNEMPDIDIDFCQSRRPEIIQYVQDKYGRDCTAGIITFNTMAAKGSLRDLGRVLDWKLPEVDRIAKLIPNVPGKKVTLQPRTGDDDGIYAVDDEPELKTEYTSNARAKKLIDMARRIEGLTRNPGRHAAGLVISDKPITEYCPLYRDKDGALLTQFEMAHIDSVGLLKIDILGLETLTVLHRCVNLIGERHGVKVDLDRLPTDDAETYRMLARGEARGIFQFESEGMVKLLMEARPDCLEDLVALNAMYRPGPMQNIPAFIARKHGKEPIDYTVPELEPILKDTYGIIVYQEQVMQIANRLANFSLSEADRLRKAMGKKKKDLMEKYGTQFVEGCMKNEIPAEKARVLYETIAKFAEYGFNKSHAAAYAFVAYQTAWLKAHYTSEFMAALLSLKQGDIDDVVLYIEESRRIGLQIAGPDVNKSETYFTIEGGKEGKTLRFSLAAIKGVGEKAVENIVEAREKEGPFKDLYDFCERVDSKAVNKGALESLIKGGAFDVLADEGGRGRMLAALEDAMGHGSSMRRDRESGQGSLFGESDALVARPKMPQVEAWTQEQVLDEEKGVLGFYFSGHPLQDIRELIEGLSSKPCRNLGEVTDGYEVILGGYVNAVQAKTTRNEGKKMVVLIVEDFTGSTQCVVFPRTYEQYRNSIKPDCVLFFRGRVKHGEGSQSASMLVEEIFSLETAMQRYLSGIGLTLRQSDVKSGGTSDTQRTEAQLQSVVELLKAHPGRLPLWFGLEIEDGPGAPALVWIRPESELSVKPVPELFKGLRQVLPPGRVRVLAQGNQAHKPAEPAWKRGANGVRA